MEQFDFDLTNMGDYRLIPQLVERVNEQIRIEGEKYICERLMDLQIDKNILLNQTQEIRRLNGILQDIKDKQEQGLLIELPCKVGDTVYFISREEIIPVLVDGFSINENGLFVCGTSEEYFGYSRLTPPVKNLYITRSEAESALAKMGGK